MKATAQTITAITETDYYTFLELSTHLTGFSKIDLLSTGMQEAYYYTIMKEPDQDEVRLFFKKAAEIVDLKNSEAIKEAMASALIFPPDKTPTADYAVLPFSGLARRIVLLWYTGSWTIFDGKEKPPISVMVSPESYTRGLVWKAAETHPAGARQPGYNSWSKSPLT